jgi:hypothetical protein
MNKKVLGNYLKMHRKRSGLSQRELGMLLGYAGSGQVSRHERSATVPPLITALAYEVIFCVPISSLFTGMHVNVTEAVKSNIVTFERDLKARSGKKSSTNLTAQKLKWLETRKTS